MRDLRVEWLKDGAQDVSMSPMRSSSRWSILLSLRYKNQFFRAISRKLAARIAALTLLVDFMLFGGEFVTAGLIWPFSVVAGLVLGLIAFKAQMRWYGDDRESAMIKGLILGLLTAIPTPLPALLYIPSGLLGMVHNFRRK